MRNEREKGIALLTTMLVLLLVSAIIVGMAWMVMTDQRLGANNEDRETAFYGAEAGMEALTASLGNTFATKGTITAADVTAAVDAPPVIPGITFANALGSTYQVLCGNPAVSPCIPASVNATILPPSPYAGMNGLVTPFVLQVAAQSGMGSEVKLQRQMQLVAIPVFQFGVFSQSDLAFFNGPSFDFGGRTHTNGNLWLSPNSGPLYMGDKVTVVGQVIRTNLENGAPLGATIAAGNAYSGVVSIALVPNPAALPAAPTYTNGNWRALALTESSDVGPSVYGAVSTVANNPTWGGVLSAYNGMLINGVAPLNLASTSLAGIINPISLIQRPAPGTAAANPAQFSQQYYSQASLRILLDDYKTPGVIGSGCAGSDMMKLDGIDTATNPTDLAGLANIAQSGAHNAGAYTPPTAGPPATPGDGYWILPGQATITGCIKIEYQDNGGAFHDITGAILGLGYRGRNLNPQTKAQLVTAGSATYLASLPAGQIGPSGCPQPDAGAIIRIERVRDNPSSLYSGGAPGNLGAGTFCGAPTPGVNTDYWPNVLFDARESTPRPSDIPGGGTGLLTAAGVMQYIELDANNLANWLKANQAGLPVNNVTGFTVYFSDRRGEQLDPNAGNTRTGAYGFNDNVNTGDPAHGCPDGVLNPGEDLAGDGVLRVYGKVESAIPNLIPVAGGLLAGNTVLEANPTFCTTTNNWPGAVYVNVQDARVNPPAFFRRALKVVNGITLNLGTSCYGVAPQPPCGLTIASENPVYLQDDFNAPNNGTWAGAFVATAIAGDAVTLLSDSWNDVNSVAFPYDYTKRVAAQTAYRVAIIGGKGIPFTNPAGQPEDYGTDGGLHNFLRFLEDWNNGAAIPCYYKGSLVSFYYNQQAIGEYKTNNTVYNPPDRRYSFDATFTNGPSWLPPKTPTLRSVNTIGFSQMLMPTQ